MGEGRGARGEWRTSDFYEGLDLTPTRASSKHLRLSTLCHDGTECTAMRSTSRPSPRSLYTDQVKPPTVDLLIK
eukprot:6492781-Amphidinium_carterae.6